MKVLVADKLEQAGIDALTRSGCDVVVDGSLSGESLAAAIARLAPKVLVVRSTKVDADALRASDALELVVRAGAGYDTIDVATASREGVFVANCPGRNAIAVAELTWALITSCDRRVPDQTAELRAGTWNKKRYSEARGLYGRTLGVLGLGTIAQEVVSRAHAFGMPVIAWSRSLTAARAEELEVELAATPLEVAERADVVTVHVASTPETESLIDAAFVAAMKPGAYLINTSRGSVVDEAAVLAGIAEKGLRVGLDVYRGEPGGSAGAFDSAIAKNPSVYGTHHVGASTDQAQQAIAMEAIRVIEHFRDTGEVLNWVNQARASKSTCALTVRHRNRPGVLAGVFKVLGEARINVEEMENLIYEGAEAACARIRLGRAPDDDQLNSILASSGDILSMELTAIPSKGATRE